MELVLVALLATHNTKIGLKLPTFRKHSILELDFQEVTVGLKELRSRVGMSQKDLADHLGLHFTAVSKWELGRMPVPQFHYKKLAELLQVSEHELRDELEEPGDQIDASVWETKVLGSEGLSIDEKLIMMTIKGLADPGTAVVATTFGHIGERLNVSAEWVEERWGAILSSGLVRQIGPINTVVKLLI